jgi:hypothetical protein
MIQSSRLSETRRKEIMQVYHALMKEAKHRMSFVDDVINGRVGFPATIARETCFLQLRLLCEIVALGCLTAHGDIPATGKLKSEWAAGKIITPLQSLHQHFYPKPATVTHHQTQPGAFIFAEKTEGFLTKTELLELAGRAGNELHRGNIRQLLATERPPTIKFDDIANWLKKIKELLDLHVIFLLGEEQQIACQLSYPPGGEVKTAYLATP